MKLQYTIVLKHTAAPLVELSNTATKPRCHYNTGTDGPIYAMTQTTSDNNNSHSLSDSMLRAIYELADEFLIYLDPPIEHH